MYVHMIVQMYHLTFFFQNELLLEKIAKFFHQV